MRKRKKRGMLGVQFNWIFVMILGALIILFFVKVVYNQKVIADRKLSVKILNELTLLTVGAEVATSTASEVDIGGNPVAFECEECNCLYYMQEFGNTYSKRYVGRSLFAPSIVKGEKIMTWALDWNMPYKVSNFLYITSPDMRYYFIYDDSNPSGGNLPPHFSDLLRKLPDQINNGDVDLNIKDIDDIGSLDYSNEYKVRIVVYDDTGNVFSSNEDNIKGFINSKLTDMEVKDISILVIKRSGSYERLGVLEFRKVVRDASSNLIFPMDSTYYLGDESLIGAILVDNYDNYVCSMDSAIQRLNKVSQIYLGRIDGLPYLNANQECGVIKDKRRSHINQIISSSQDDFTSWTDMDSATQIWESGFNTAASLQEENDNALLFSCPLMY